MTSKRSLESFLLCFFIGFSFFGYSQPRLTQSSEVSLLTCAPGTEIYSLFGHSALRIKDDSIGLDLVFNYGIFSYNTDNFIFKFTKGETFYKLGIQRFGSFMREYTEEGRGVYEQVLNLDMGEKTDLFNRLNLNYLPENRQYLYKFFLDNCATRPRDIVESALNKKLEWKSINNSYIALPANHWKSDEIANCQDKWGTLSYRDIISLYFGDSPWSAWGINFGLGQPTDTAATDFSSMFAPDFLMNSFANARIEKDGKFIPLVKEQSLILQHKSYVSDSLNLFTPAIVFLLVFLIALYLSYIELKGEKFFVFFDMVLFGLTGLMGLVIVFLSFFSIHDFVTSNYDILWASPFNLLFALFLPFKKIRQTTMLYSFISFTILVILLMLWSSIPENLSESSIFLILAMIVRNTMGMRYIFINS